jgi:hypothetical protein
MLAKALEITQMLHTQGRLSAHQQAWLHDLEQRLSKVRAKM